MITIDAQWDQKQKNILMSRLSTVQRMVYYYMQPGGELPRQLSIKYVEETRSYLLDARKGKFGYTPYNPEYAEWKKKYGKLSGFWNLMGDLFENVKSSRSGDGYFGGVVSTAMDRGGKSWFGKGDRGPSKSIAMYGTVMEEGMPVSIKGSGVHPARPLFVPVFKEFTYSKSRASAGLAWSICDSALMKIGDAWKK